jgi:hypothetical protein
VVGIVVQVSLDTAGAGRVEREGEMVAVVVVMGSVMMVVAMGSSSGTTLTSLSLWLSSFRRPTTCRDKWLEKKNGARDLHCSSCPPWHRVQLS